VHNVTTGDVAHTSRVFTAADFAAFAEATGDRNPLHHDPDHAAETEFGVPVVPLAMVLGPVSALIGMDIPGPGAVILDTAFRPVRAVAFDRPVEYSLRVRSVSASTGVLTCRVLAFQNRQVVLDGEVRSTVRAPRPRAGSSGQLIRAGSPKLAVVTGAAGDIGSAIARRLARAGWQLALMHRGRVDEVIRDCSGVVVHSVRADLSDAADRAAAAKELAALTPTALIHAAAPPLTAGHAEHVEVGYGALRDLTEAVIDGMLLRQEGSVVLIGSEASRYHPHGWSDYVAGKAAAASVLHGIDRHYGTCGIRAVLVEPGYVQGRYSAAVRPAGALGLMPEEVADVVADELARPGAPAGRVWLTPDGAMAYALDGTPEPVADTAAAEAVPAADDSPAASAPRERIAAVVRRVLGADVDPTGGGVGITPGWDSLRQIQIVLAVEAEFDIRLSSASLASTGRFDQLCRTVIEQAGA